MSGIPAPFLPTHPPHSELDLAIVGDEPLPDATLARLLDDLTESDLPFKVDVVELCRVAPAFRELVERDHVVLRRPCYSTRAPSRARSAKKPG